MQAMCSCFHRLCKLILCSPDSLFDGETEGLHAKGSAIHYVPKYGSGFFRACQKLDKREAQRGKIGNLPRSGFLLVWLVSGPQVPCQMVGRRIFGIDKELCLPQC
ncbi:unnamed protein product [Effrenium voratum]|uniref:Uncharacterized protein n=1 Tax=Effrenium voratum TaxID=2562239 RepID=A0AA36NC82_9DINO|nr:unnamed protein product [Effrenium voratum]